MQRTFVVVMVPALIFLALSIIALEPGKNRETAAVRTHNTPAAASDTTTRRPPETKPTGLLPQEDTESSTTNAATEPDKTAKPAVTDANGFAASTDDTDESLAQKFARLMNQEQALKSTASTKSVAQRDAKPAKTATATATPDSVEQPQPVAPRRPRAAPYVPDTTRQRLISALPVRVARSPDDLVDLDAAQTIGQLTLTGDQFTNRSLKYLEGLQVLAISIEAVQINDGSLVHLAQVKGLRELRLWTPGVTDAGLAPLDQINGLELLDLEGTNAQGLGLINMRGLNGLVQLTLGPRTEDQALVLLASFPNLVELDLRPCSKLTDDGMKTVAQHQQLRMLRLPSHIGAAGKQTVRQGLPNCQVR